MKEMLYFIIGFYIIFSLIGTTLAALDRSGCDRKISYLVPAISFGCWAMEKK